MCELPGKACELPDPHGHTDTAAHLTRRGVLRGGGLLAAGALLPGASHLLRPAVAYADTTTTGALVVPMAMHVHGSFSEGASGASASWESQLAQAELAGIKVLWPTDHDWRMSAHQAPEAFHTDNLRERVQGRAYVWQPAPEGALASSVAAAVAGPASPADASARKGSLHLAAVSSGPGVASSRLYLDGGLSNHAHRTNITDQVVRLQVLADSISADAYGELLITLSHHPARGSRPAGSYQLSYRFGIGPAASRTEGLLGIVEVPVAEGGWNEISLDLTRDVAAAWPDLVAEDNALTDLWVGATSRGGAPASVHVAFLRFTRRADGDVPLEVQRQIFRDSAAGFPGVVVRQGLEVSLRSAHLNWFGGDQHLVDYDQPEAQQASKSVAAYSRWSAELIHGYGGLVSLNHPFGSDNGLASPAQQDDQRRTLAARLIPARAYGVDLLEVGYRVRGGAGLETHLALWDALSRAGVWLTGNGVNDAHGGKVNDWRRITNRFVTSALAGSTGEADLLTALAGGRAYVHELGAFGGLLDITVEQSLMGSVSVAPARNHRPLTLAATQLPRGAEVRLVQGPVDHGSAVDSGAQVVARVSSDALRSGTATVQVQTPSSTFVRAELWTAQGRLVAFTNPIWLLKEQPPVAPEPARRSPDTVFRDALLPSTSR